MVLHYFRESLHHQGGEGRHQIAEQGFNHAVLVDLDVLLCPHYQQLEVEAHESLSDVFLEPPIIPGNNVLDAVHVEGNLGNWGDDHESFD